MNTPHCVSFQADPLQNRHRFCHGVPGKTNHSVNIVLGEKTVHKVSEDEPSNCEHEVENGAEFVASDKDNMD